MLAEGLAYFDRPRLACLLEMLGVSKTDRVEVLATMLRNCPPEEFDEMLDIFERATARAARQRASVHDRDEDEPGERRRRYSASAERRAQRRRTS